MADTTKFMNGWRDLSLEDRGLLLTLTCSSKTTSWGSIAEAAQILGVDEIRAKSFVDAAAGADVLLVEPAGRVSLLERADDLRKNWERRFDEIFWPSVTTPWKKLGRANALKVWRTSTFALIKPKTEEAADALCQKIMDGVERYKLLLSQPNAPSIKYPEGWLSGQRWSDEIDETFIEQHGQTQPQLPSLSPLERARRQQSEQQQVIEYQSIIQSPAIQAAVETASERRNELALPEFTVTL